MKERNHDDRMDSHETYLDNNAGRRLVYLFPGGGVQYPGMGRELYRYDPAFRGAVDLCRELLRSEGAYDVLPAFVAPPSDEEVAKAIRLPSRSGVCTFVYQYAMVQLLASIGLTPDAVVGHSLGEYASAVTSGALTLSDALMIMHVRGTLLERLPEPGAMLLVAESAPVLGRLLEEGTAIVALNGPRSNGVAGSRAAIDAMAQRLGAEGISYHRIRYGAASHCHLVDPLLPHFEAALANCSLQAAQVPWVSTVTTRPQPTGAVVDAAYWRQQFREPVYFGDTIHAMNNEGSVVFVEVGPQNGLANLVTSNVPEARIIGFGQHAKDTRDNRFVIREALEALRVQGVNVTRNTLYGDQLSSLERALPEAPLFADSTVAPTVVSAENDVEFIVRAVWQQMFGKGRIGLSENFFDLGGHSLLAVRMHSELRMLFQFEFPLGIHFEHPTVRGLAGAVMAAGRVSGIDVEAIATTLREVCEISDEELVRLMADDSVARCFT